MCAPVLFRRMKGLTSEALGVADRSSCKILSRLYLLGTVQGLPNDTRAAYPHDPPLKPTPTIHPGDPSLAISSSKPSPAERPDSLLALIAFRRGAMYIKNIKK